MNSRPPPDDSGERKFLSGLRGHFQRAKSALKPSDPAPRRSGLLSPPSSSFRLFSRSRTTTPTSSPRILPADLDQNATSPSLQPPTEAALGDSTTSVGERHEIKSASWSRLIRSLRSLESNMELFPPLKSAIGIVIDCLDIVQVPASNRKEYEQLAEELGSIVNILDRYASELDSETSNGSIANIAQCIEDQLTSVKEKKDRGTLELLRDDKNNQEDVIMRYRQIESLFRQLQCDVTMRTRTDVKKQLEISLLRGMSPVDDARYNSSYSDTIKRRGCTAQTRETIQQNLQKWVTDPTSEKIYWMNGMAGTGKTTIAYSFCEWLERTKRLGGSFFCSRTSLKNHPDAGALNVAQQFEQLLYEPTLKAKDAIPDCVVIVIDALDECDDSYSVHMLLNVLLKYAGQFPLKFFVASRPEYFIRDRMLAQEGAARSVMHLHDIEQWIVEEDIKKYLTEALRSMSPPPSAGQVTLLAKRAGKLFIYAATVVRYLHPKVIAVNSGARLDAVLKMIGSKPEADADSKFKDLDRLYTTVLDTAFHEDLSLDENDSMRSVLWTIICAKEPMGLAVIASLAGMKEDQAQTALQSLRSVLHIPEKGGLISTLHASFPEYILNKMRSHKYHCDGSKSNEALAHRCLTVMNELHFNMCSLPSSYLTDDKVTDLELQITQCISPTLSYASRYWGGHLLLAPAVPSSCEMLVDFLSTRLLFWLEVLSLLRSIRVGVLMLHQVQTWLLRLEASQEIIQKQVADARNFVTWFTANPCSRSTPHIYISALPLCAKSNWVYQHYSKRMQGLANIAISQRDEAVLAIWSTESPVNRVAVSPDGDRIAAGSRDGSIHIYDTHTGAVVAGPLKGHTDNVWSVAFSRDGTQLASGSLDNTVIVWDTHSGSIVSGPLKAHTAIVYSVSFSRDGSRIASGSWDRSVIVWEVSSGRMIVGPLLGHTNLVKSVDFSPDGTLIASGSKDRTIRLWNAQTGAAVGEPLGGHEGGVNQVRFSPDGRRVASCSDDQSIQVWDVAAGSVAIPAFQGHKSVVYSVDFSRDGKYIVSGGQDKVVIVWDVLTGKIAAGPFHGHSDYVPSVGFLSDGTRVVSCSPDRTIRIWDIRKQDDISNHSDTYITSLGPVAFSMGCSRFVSSSPSGSLHVRELHTGDNISQLFEGQLGLKSIQSVAFSPTGFFVAASGEDHTIKVWNALTGEPVSPVLHGHTKSVTCIEFSPDGAFLCSGSDDTTIRIWDIKTSALLAQPCERHTAAVCSVSYSPDGGRIVSGGADHLICIWDAATGIIVHTLIGRIGTVECVAFSPDGSHVISGGSDGSVRKWNINNGNSFETPFKIRDKSGSSGSGQDLDPDESVMSSREEKLAVSCVRFAHDGTRVVAGSGSSIRLFNAHTMELISELFAPKDETVRWVGFTPDGASIVFVSIPQKELHEDKQVELEKSTRQTSWRPNSRIDKTTTPPANHWSCERDGWVTSPQGFVLWAPLDLLPYLERESLSHETPFVLSPDGVVDLGYNHLCVGDKWTECYTHKD
ncbi:unnamed protein product [Rhizoctonia solani]|uniref:Nephrocystin 3-like N-terminal domain-containing protein n=1 Tax=Rhizoctonia solani TaxID=456999 RepID=A0A8H3GMZ7_9AGAM|nr:unnamed protein product [Rhizoctonia solani]